MADEDRARQRKAEEAKMQRAKRQRAEAELKRKHAVWAGSECFTFGMNRRSGVPALVVLGQSGEEVAFVDAERRGPQALQKWPPSGEWTAAAA